MQAKVMLREWKQDEVKELHKLLKSTKYTLKFPNGKAFEVPVFCKVVFNKKQGTISIFETQDTFSTECLDAIFDCVIKCGGYIQQRSEIYLMGIPKK